MFEFELVVPLCIPITLLFDRFIIGPPDDQNLVLQL